MRHVRYAGWWLVALLAVPGCKTPGGDSALRSDAAGVDACPVSRGWAGNMKFRLVDAGGSASIDCVRIGEGLHHIGLKPGDRIVGLNGRTVRSVAEFEAAATAVASDVERPAQRFVFEVERQGKRLTIKPKDEYPGCGLYVYDDCGPLYQN